METSELVAVWADSTWCFMTELHEMTHMSDDYEVIPFNEEIHV